MGIGRIGGAGGIGGAGAADDAPEAASEGRAAPRARESDEGNAALPFDPAVKPVKIAKKDIAREPSGIVFHPERGTLFVVGDRGHVIEMDRDGKVLNRERVGHRDFEGITVGPGGRIYAVDEEAPPTIVEMDPDTLEVLRKFKIDPDFDGKRVICRRENDGLEGLCYVEEDGAFYALNEDNPPRIVRLEVPLDDEDGGKAKIEKVIDLKKVVTKKASDLMYDPVSRHFLVTEAGEGRMPGAVHEVTRKGKAVRTVPIPGQLQEGLALDDRGAAFIAQDGGGILRVDPR